MIWEIAKRCSEAKNEALRGVKKSFYCFHCPSAFFTLRRCFRNLNSLTIIQNQTENNRRAKVYALRKNIVWGIYFEENLPFLRENRYGLMPGRLFTSRPEENEDFYWTKTDMIGAAVIGIVFVLSGLIFVSYRMGLIRCPCWWVLLKWDASSRWSFHPISVWGSNETTTMGTMHPSLVSDNLIAPCIRN